MSELMGELALDERRRRGVTVLVVAACLAGIGVWLTGPLGIVMLTRGDAAGWVLLVAAVALAVAMVLAIVAAVRVRVAPSSLPGKANARFDEPQPSPDPRGGNAWIGSGIGSR
jgi:NO-binding membrane sensor protein with MHYT domain